MTPASRSDQSNSLGIAGFVLSLLGILGTCGLLSPVGLIVSLVALKREPKGFAIAGVILGALGSCGLILGLLGVLFAFGLVASILVGAGLAAVIAPMLSPNVEAQMDMAQIDKAVYQYQQANSSLPASLDLLTLSDDTRKDRWGRDYLYTPAADGTWSLKSAGEDGVMATPDDLTFGEGPVEINLR